MAVAIQISNIEGLSGGDLYVEGILVPSGNYAAGGDAVDFTGVNSVITKASSFSGVGDSITSTFLKQLSIWSQGGNLAQDYYGIVPASGSPSGAKFKVRTAGGSSELGAGAYPAAITGDTIAFYATFKRLQ